MTCPICKKQPTPDYRPFCSKRCADLDLGNWLKGSYAIPPQDPVDGLPDEDDSGGDSRTAKGHLH